MPLEHLEALASLSIPDSCCFVRAARSKTVPLGVERNLQTQEKENTVTGLRDDSQYIFNQQKGGITKHLSPSQPGIYLYTKQFLHDRKDIAGTNTRKLKSRQK